MAVYEFPALGFDPVAGDPATVERLQHDAAVHADVLAEAVQRLSRLHAGSWVGRASDGFHEEVRSLPADLDRAARAYREVAGALAAYAGELASARSEAIALEQRAEQARQARQLALDHAQRLSSAPEAESERAQHERTAELQSARRQADLVGDGLEGILVRAQALREQVEGVAAVAAGRIDAAAGSPPYRRPGAVQEAWNSVTGYVRDHADEIRQISAVLKVVSAVAGVLAFVPVAGTFFAAVALVSAGVALALDLLLKLSTGEGSWRDLAMDAGLLLIPGAGRLIKTLAEAGGGAAVATGAGRLTTAVDRGVDMRGVTPRAVWRDTTEPLWRFDDRPPEQIFRDGFHPRNAANTNLERHVIENAPSAFVATTRNAGLSFARQFRYEIHAPGGIDVDRTAGRVLYPGEEEVAFPGGLEARFIRGAHRLLPDGGLGEWIPNPGFAPT